MLRSVFFLASIVFEISFASVHSLFVCLKEDSPAPQVRHCSFVLPPTHPALKKDQEKVSPKDDNKTENFAKEKNQDTLKNQHSIVVHNNQQ